MGRPTFRKVDLTRKPAPISEKLVSQLYSKANRVDRSDLVAWLPNYFDDVPIGLLTYAIRHNLFKTLKRFRNTSHPMHFAWKEKSPQYIDDTEFVLDIRKGEWTDEEIQKRMEKLVKAGKDIQKAKQDGCWFAKTITSNYIMDIPGFVRQFKNLQSYVNFVTQSTPSSKISDLLDEKR